jgi:hypothetical protein
MADRQLTEQLNAFKDQWAKDLGYSDFKAYQKANKKGGTLQQRLERGEGVFESIGGAVGDKIKGIKEKAKSIKETFTTVKGFRKGLAGVIPGDNLLGAYVRGKVRGREKDSMPDMSSVSPSKMGGGDMSSFAKDVLTIRQAVSTLLDFERESQEQSEKQKQSEFLAQQDAKEAELEASRVSSEPMSATVTTPQGEGEESGGGIKNIFSNVISNILGGLKKGFKFLFQPSKLLKVLGKVFIIGTIIISLFKGITAGFDRWKETGSISEAIIAGLGAIVDFLSFGFFGEDTVRSVFDTVGGWINKLKDTIVDTFYDVKDWIVNNIGIPQFSLPMWAVAPPIALINKGAELIGKEAPFPKEVTIGPFYPFKDNKTSATPEYSQRPQKEEEPEKTKVEEMSTDVGVSAPQDMPKPEDLGAMAQSKVENLGMQMKEGIPKVDEKSPSQISDMMTGNKAGSMFGGLDSLVQQYGGDEASESLKKDQGKLQSFNESGGIAGKFGEMGQASTGVGASMDNATQSIADKIKSGGVESGPSMPNLGQKIGESSADVETGQRMESTPDMGNVFNSPQITNNKGSMGKKKLPPADVFNSDFANVLMRT